MSNQKVAIITLGCSKNTVESESVAGLFLKEGFDLTNDIFKSDIIVIHTCSFIKDARLESENCIKYTGEIKEKKPYLKIFVSGCLPQLLKNQLLQKYPFIDGCVGTGNFGDIVKLIKKDVFFKNTEIAGGMNDSSKRVLSSSLPTTYIKISEGCNHKCSFCIIPKLRGKYQSRSINSIVNEAKALADCGIKEINIIAQDTTSYGLDIYGKLSLHKLMDKLSQINDLKWIRLLYAYPSRINKQLLDVISQRENICKYIDIPIQHISKHVLKNMARPVNAREIVENIKKQYPDIILRTSIIAGFPRETEEDFKELVGFVRENHFEHIGIFGYSDQKNAKSFNLKNKIKHELIETRKQIVANAQFQNVLKNNKNKIGKSFEFLIENIAGKKAYGRTYFQAPEIDNNVFVNLQSNNIKAGEFKKIIVSGIKDYDIIAQLETEKKAGWKMV
ncbi:MAG: 30S ribosomal protein S12 methylthiotransferase RimO [Endomicrobiaceae bacterium]|nr:30S ribosomal protein S12 methylthiotransferase RimO [Endomicrobiaceae bacterium]